ncbi:hypothetical protein IQ230_14665 [Gloeocapsopsis crepidinum LEGE 06123]|uniref:Phage-Barnase-EndoU-ColicinE5/D-RelE like nuclease 2 domain-containing protein n=2 Tax=Gloeocapsopsis crepidinum TaxID=693223 RepID=A0ABR9UTE0_9CHRO|nr:hypothetical protein [Gloeocapsopsis crepidinum LEGE 06123]
MVAIAHSKNNIPIRLPDERWQHILEEHPELVDSKTKLLEVISQPKCILEGREGELLAMQEIQPGKWLVVAYRELINDGFVITAFLTCRRQYLTRRRQIWP